MENFEQTHYFCLRQHFPFGSGITLANKRRNEKSVENLLERTSRTLEDIDLIVFHQASKLVIDNLVQRLSLDVNKVFTNYDSVGNTVSATIPIALKDAVSQGRLHNGDIVMVVGFGVGLSWGATMINWTMEG